MTRRKNSKAPEEGPAKKSKAGASSKETARGGGPCICGLCGKSSEEKMGRGAGLQFTVKKVHKDLKNGGS